MRIIIKGGVWKNTEDEILKAAVMKYGKNQWARISSLLTRKTAKACKARWYEWLDPSIKKTEWSKEEDEKLLQLAKLMPTQWRTIAPIVGRTPSQCLERYQRLLDEAEAKGGELGLTGPEGGESSAPSADDVRRLRPGEIDPDPEAKPARPDPVDMDEDEKEMLSEARARLANTQGKKAKRKARERQLEEARRLATLQKRRELKAAGIELKTKRKRRGIDYNADIPFEKRPAPGFFDTTEENERAVSLRGLTNVQLSKLEGKRRAEIEEEERKKDIKKQKLKKEKEKESGEISFVPAGGAAKAAALAKAAEQAKIARRKKLVLPAPQVGEGELEEIVKIGIAGEEAKALAEEDEHDATRGLIGSYTPATSGLAARTPRTPAQVDSIMLEARNQLVQTRIQTPLMGQENAAVEDSGFGFEGITPRRSVQQTPNPLLTPLHGGDAAGVARTPGTTPRQGGAGPSFTPLRDEFSINTERGVGAEGVELTPRDERLRAAAAKKALRDAFQALPAPANNFELAPPELADGDEAEPGEATVTEQDASDVDRLRRQAKAAQEKERFALRSLAVQRNLPRPVTFLLEFFKVGEDEDDSATDEVKAARFTVHEEMARILQHDAVKYPVPGAGRAPPGAVNAVETEFTLAELESARNVVDEEVKRMGEFNSEGAYEAGRNEVERGVVYDVERKITLPYISGDSESTARRVRELKYIYSELRDTAVREAQRIEKLDKRIKLVLGGYGARSQTLSKRLAAVYDELDKARAEFANFSALRDCERECGPLRLAALQADLERLRVRQWEVTNRYHDLVARKAALEEEVGKVDAVETDGAANREQGGVKLPDAPMDVDG